MPFPNSGGLSGGSFGGSEQPREDNERPQEQPVDPGLNTSERITELEEDMQQPDVANSPFFEQFNFTDSPAPARSDVQTVEPMETGLGTSFEGRKEANRSSLDRNPGFLQIDMDRFQEDAEYREEAEEQVEAEREQVIDIGIEEITNSLVTNEEDPEKFREYSQRLRTALEQAGDGDAGEGIIRMQASYNKLQSEDPEVRSAGEREVEAFESQLRDQGFSEEEIQMLANNFKRNDTDIRNVIERLRTLERRAILVEEDPQLLDEIATRAEANRREGESFDDAFRRETNLFARRQLAQNPQSQLAKGLEALEQEQQQADQLRQRAQQVFRQQQAEQIVAQQAEPILTVASTVQLLEFGVDGSTLANLPPEGQRTVERIVKERGGAKLVGTLLANNNYIGEDGAGGEISGQQLFIPFGEDANEVYLVGENAADRGNRLTYPIDPPNAAGLEAAMFLSIPEQNRWSYMAQHQAQTSALWEIMVGDPNDEDFPNTEKIDRFRNFLLIILGEGNPEGGNEGRRLQMLGITTQGTEVVDDKRVNLFIEAIERYIPDGLVMQEGDSPTTLSPESPSFNFEDALTLATLWDDNARRMPTRLRDLKKLTQARLAGEDITGIEPEGGWAGGEAESEK